MAFDALSLSVITQELSEILTGGKITKIYQPEKDEIILFVFNGRTYKLLISANAGVNRIHITEMKTDNPKSAPSFCMLLRKHLTNAEILSVRQMPYERVADFTVRIKDELGYRTDMHLIFELTGKTSNIILTDQQYTVLDSIKHLPQDLESARIIMPGVRYNFFAPQNKIPPFDSARVGAFLAECALPLRQALTQNLLGVSQSTVNEILYGIDENNHGEINNSRVLDALAIYKTNLRMKKPNVVFSNGCPSDVCPFDYRSKKGEKKFFDTLNRAHDNYYFFLDKAQRFADKAKSVNTVVKNAVSRIEKKLAIQKQSVLDAAEREKYRIYGDLIISNLYRIKKEDDKLTAENYFEEGAPQIIIPLDKSLSPQQNAQSYYKKYRKLKSSEEHNSKLAAENEKLLEYLLTVKHSLSYCTEAEDLEEIRRELTDAGIIRDKKSASGKKEQLREIKPLRYNIHGYTVLVGKNNLQNNYVTFKAAKSDDIWLHAQKIHSSHAVILRENDDAVPNSVIEETAAICAYYSQARNGSKIAVDYTERKNVKKPPKSAPGFAIYNVYRTVIVDPDAHSENLI